MVAPPVRPIVATLSAVMVAQVFQVLVIIPEFHASLSCTPDVQWDRACLLSAQVVCIVWTYGAVPALEQLLRPVSRKA